MPRKKKLPEGIRERGGTYHADFYANGRRVRKKLSTNLDVAKQLLTELKARADRADFGLLDNDYSLSELQTSFLDHCKQVKRPSTVESYQICLNNILSQLPSKAVRQINIEQVIHYRAHRLSLGKSPRRVNMETGALSNMLRWAVKNKLIGSNPLNDLDPLPHDQPKEGRALTNEEVSNLLEVSEPHWHDIWYAFLTTGMRKSELAQLTFHDVDWDSREIIVRKGVAKTHRERRIPIDNGLWNILQKQLANREKRKPGKGKSPKVTKQVQARFTTDHVFVTTQNTPLDNRSTLYFIFQRCCKEAGIDTKPIGNDGKPLEHVDLHSLRRTFATSLIIGGTDPKTVQELLGHKTLEMTMKIYAKVHHGTKRQAIGNLPYGNGVLAPEGVLDYTSSTSIPVQNSHKLGTDSKDKTG